MTRTHYPHQLNYVGSGTRVL